MPKSAQHPIRLSTSTKTHCFVSNKVLLKVKMKILQVVFSHSGNMVQCQNH